MSECSCSPLLPSPDVDIRSVFCSGPLLDRVQRSNMFPDSKYFVDMSCIYTPAQTMADYEMFSNCARNDGSLEFLKMFVERHFNPPGLDLEPWTPTDWKAQPSFLHRISDPQMKQFAAEINELWKQLGRRIKDDVQKNPELFTIIYVPKPFIIADTDCREYSYWGSFWIIRGLLQCGMIQTARGMIENFLYLVQQYGYVPACGRIYCDERTQPPLLIMMMKAYVEVTRDEQFAIQSLPLLETEFETFVSQRSIEVKGRTMYQYRSASRSPGPRPEAYAEDLAAAENIEDEQAREQYYTELKSASESGQEFSSRWFVSSNEAILSDTKPSAIVPVELNAIIFRSGKILAEFNRKAGNARKAEEYQDRSCVLVKAIRDVLWNCQAGIWLDYDVEKKQSRNYFCCTNFAPLWARAFPLIDTDKVSKGVMEHIKTNKLDDLYGGVPHTMNKQAGEKWDYPNVFPPMMFMVVEGLDNLGTRASKAMSRRWAHRWVKSNYDAFKAQGFMFEKYFCEEFGSSAGACPSRTAVGYGWSNAVIIEFLCKYGREISMSEDEDKACQCRAGKKKDSYVITSHASMETNAFRTTSSRDVEKMKTCLCGELISKTTAAIGTQSSFRPASSSKSMDRKSCTCSTNKSTNCGQVLDDCSCAPVVPKPPPKECCCCAGSRAHSSGRCQHQEVPTCSCSISRNQMVPVQLESEHYHDCPCYKQKQSKCFRSSSKHKEKVPKLPKQPKQKDLEANLKRQTDSDWNSPSVSDVQENIKKHKSSKDLKDLKDSTSEEQQKWSKKQKKHQEELSRYSSEEQEKFSKMQKQPQDQFSEETQKWSKKQKKHQEELSRYSSEEQEKFSKMQRQQQDQFSEETQKLSKKQKKHQEELSRYSSEEQEKLSKMQRQQQDQFSEETQKLSKKQKKMQDELSRVSSSEEQEKLAKRAKSKESVESHGKKLKAKDQKGQIQEPILSEEDRERERLRRQANLVGHYAPLADRIADDCPKKEPKKKRCCDCNDEGASEDDLNCGERRSPSNEVYFSPQPISTTESSGCSAQPSRAQGQGSPGGYKSSDGCSCSGGSGHRISGAQSRTKQPKLSKSQQRQYSLSGDYPHDPRSAAQTIESQGQGAYDSARGKVANVKGDYSYDERSAAQALEAQGQGAYDSARGKVGNVKSDYSYDERSAAQALEARGQGAYDSAVHGKGARGKQYKLGRSPPQPHREVEARGCSPCNGGMTTLQKPPGRLQYSTCSGGPGPAGYSPTDQNMAAEKCPCFSRNMGADDIWCPPCPSGKHSQVTAKSKKAQSWRAHEQSTQSTTGVCPHCGGVSSDPKPASSTGTMGQDNIEDCDCDQAHMKGMSSIGLQRGCCKPEPTTRSWSHDCGCSRPTNANFGTHNQMENLGYYPKAGEYCSCHGKPSGYTPPPPKLPPPKSNFDIPVYGPERVPCTCCADSMGAVPSGRGASVSSARAAPAGNCPSCEPRQAKDHSPDYGPSPFYNKQFPLRDPVSEFCVPKKKEKTKCCTCDEKKEEQ